MSNFQKEMMKIMAESAVECFAVKGATPSLEEVGAWVEANKAALVKGAALALTLNS